MSDNSRQPDYYGILGIDKSYSTDDIRATRRQLSRQFHPSGSEPNEARMSEINAACDFLEDSEKRKDYDRKLAVKAAVEEHETKAAGAKRGRARSPKDAKAFGDRMRNQASSTAEGPPPGYVPPPQPPPPRPPPHSPTPSRPPAKMPRSPISEADVVLPLDEFPPIDWGTATARIGALVASLVLLGSPFYIMSATGAASNDHLSGGWAIELGCFALFVLGLVAVACVLGNIFSRD